MYKEEKLTHKIIGLAMNVHRKLGPGYQETIYHRALIISLQDAGLEFETEKEIDVYFRNNLVGSFRLDMLVEDKIVVELKALTGQIPKIFQTQTISYLKATNLEVGLLINFGNSSLEVKRLARYKDFVNNNLYKSV